MSIFHRWPVLLLALLLTTGRRLKEAGSLTWPQFKQGESPRLELKKTKTSRKNNKLLAPVLHQEQGADVDRSQDNAKNRLRLRR